MSKLRQRRGIKFLCFFGIAVLIISSVMGICSQIALFNGGFYADYNSAEEDIYDFNVIRYSENIVERYLHGDVPEILNQLYADGAFRFELYDEGAFVCGSYRDEDTEYIRAYISDNAINLRLYCYVLPGAQEHNDLLGRELRFYKNCYEHRLQILICSVVSLLAAVLLLIKLLPNAGRFHNNGERDLRITDKMPVELNTLVVMAISVLAIMLVDRSMGLYGGIIEQLAKVFMVLCIMVPMFLWWLKGVAVRLNYGGLFTDSLSYGYLRSFRELNLLKKAVLVLVWVLVLELAYIYLVGGFHSENLGLILGWAGEKLLSLPVLAYVLVNIYHLREGTSELARGNTGARIDAKAMHGELRAIADDLNSIGAVVQSAVEDKVKSERFRAELITNVSHDIKTPLTSIVSYVDLLDKEVGDNEELKKYTTVLKKQSEKLRKLVVDLVEASKAASGALKVELERCQLPVLIEQTAGEYIDRLEKAGLKLQVNMETDSADIMADGRHMWRVLDNLLSNVCKYALVGSRVYIDLYRRENEAVVSIRNVCREQLDADAAHLAERFVRGSQSRSTEGAGLGLSIADSLTRLQGGRLQLSVDGDVFKAELSFPLAE